MLKAVQEEKNGKRITNTAIILLKKSLNAIAGRVTGTDAARKQAHSMLWSTSYLLNLPNLWVTINPDDIDDPIAQVLAGAKFNLDNFDPEDPYASAQYFNLVVNVRSHHYFGGIFTFYGNYLPHSLGNLPGMLWNIL